MSPDEVDLQSNRIRPGWSAVCNLGDDRGTEDVMRRRNAVAAVTVFGARTVNEHSTTANC